MKLDMKKRRSNPAYVRPNLRDDYDLIRVRYKPIYKIYKFLALPGYTYKRGRRTITVPRRYGYDERMVRRGYVREYFRLKPAAAKKRAALKRDFDEKTHEWINIDMYLQKFERAIHREYKKLPIYRLGSPYMPKGGTDGIHITSPRYLNVDKKLLFNWSFTPETVSEEREFFSGRIYDLCYIHYYIKVYKSVKAKVVFTYKTLGLPEKMSIEEIARDWVPRYVNKVIKDIGKSRKGIEFIAYTHFSVGIHRYNKPERKYKKWKHRRGY